MADDYQITLVRLGKGGKVTAPGEGWKLVSMAASIAPGSVWLAWRLATTPKLRGCPTCKGLAKLDPDTEGPCIGCGTVW